MGKLSDDGFAGDAPAGFAVPPAAAPQPIAAGAAFMMDLAGFPMMSAVCVLLMDLLVVLFITVGSEAFMEIVLPFTMFRGSAGYVRAGNIGVCVA